jgi:hypothetical protein
MNDDDAPDNDEEMMAELDKMLERLTADGILPKHEYDSGYYILDGHTPVHLPSNGRETTLTWARWFEEHRADRIVKQEQIGPYWISTVFLGLDHGLGRMLGISPRNQHPILFETMVFAVVGTERKLDVQERCSTWEEAEEQHERIAEQFRKAING